MMMIIIWNVSMGKEVLAGIIVLKELRTYLAVMPDIL